MSNESTEDINEQLKREVKVFDSSFDDFIYNDTDEETPRDELVHATFVLDEAGDVVFPAVVLGFGTSYRDGHNHPPGFIPPPKPDDRTMKCSGCRWTDVVILWSDTSWIGVSPGEQTYVLLTRVFSVVPEEQTFIKQVWTKNPEEILKGLSRPSRSTYGRTARGAQKLSFDLPKPSEAALIDASYRDEGIAEVADLYMEAKGIVLPEREPDQQVSMESPFSNGY